MTGYSTISVRVEYRTQMTITPCKTMGSDPNFSCSSSSQQSAPIWAKSDHFISADNLENVGIIRKNISNPDYGDTITTSDESSEAMRVFAASPPDNFIHKRFSDHYSSNESIGIKFRSRSNTNQSHKSEDISNDSNEVKLGAFATKKISSDNIKTSEADDDFLDLFNVEQEKGRTPLFVFIANLAFIYVWKHNLCTFTWNIFLSLSSAKKANMHWHIRAWFFLDLKTLFAVFGHFSTDFAQIFISVLTFHTDSRNVFKHGNFFSVSRL